MKNHTNRTDNGYSIKKGKRALILIASLFAAIAVAVTCALSFGGYSKQVGVDNVANNGISTSTTYTNTTGDKSAQGALAAGDILSYTYVSAKTYSITLPMGSFKFETWGAAGGGADPGIGGCGGYMSATMKFTAKTTLTITVGQGGVYQSGAQSVGTRAYGGGGGGFGYGGGGGGGTFVDIGSTALIVAGGGGGAADTCGQGTVNGTTSNHAYAVGRGGYPATHAGILKSGTSGATSIGTPAAAGSSGAGGYGATTSGPGAGNGTNASYKGGNGSGRQGGDGNKGSTNSGGGGGGGYYGGGGGGGDTAAGGGGSSYYNSSYVLSGTTYSTTAPSDKPVKASNIYTNSNTGHTTGENGEVRITVVSVNQAPTQKSVALTTFTRGGTINKTLNASDLASDPEGTAVYFTNGTSSNYDTYSNCTTNSGLYLDSACTVSANKFFTWTFSGNTSFTINGIKAYPRSGQTSVTYGSGGNTVRIYTKVRDNYGTNTTRAISTVYFDVKVNKNSMSLKSSVNAAVVDSAGASSTAGCMIGSSVETPAPGDPASATAIYNPNGPRITTLFIKKTLMLGGKITLNAANLINNVLGVDQAVIALTDTTKITGSSRLFKVTQLDSGASKVTTYNTGLTAIANTFSSISLECVTPTPGYQVLPVTVYIVEKAACNGTNVALWDASSGMLSYSFQIVFKMENTRPVLKSGVDNVVDLSVGETNKAIKLNDYFSDIDNASGINSSTHSILGVEVPKNEFIALDRLQNTVTLASPNQNYYNKGTKTADSFATTAKTDLATGFLDNIAYNATAGGTDTSREAFIRFTYSGDTITVTGLRASFSQYTSTRANAPGHFYLLLHIRDNCDSLDNGIWLPLAFRVGATTAKPSDSPVATVTAPNNTASSQTKSSVFPKAAGTPGQSFYFAPMAVNYNGSHVVGLYKDSTGALTDENLQPLAIDGDNYATTTGLKSWNGAYLNEMLQLSSTPESVVKSMSSYLAKKVGDGWENQYIRAENIPIYIDSAYFPKTLYGGGRIVVPDGALTVPAGTGFTVWSPTKETVGGKVYYVINGLKITLKSATMNRYFYADAGVTDIAGLASESAKKIKIAVRVTNTALSVERTDGNVAVYGDKAESNAYSEYSNDGIPTLSYKIPLGTTFIVTPYDIAYDYDIQNAGFDKLAGGFTLNGLNGSISGGLLTVSADKVDGGFNGLFDKSKYASVGYTGKLTEFLNGVNDKTTVGHVSNVADGTSATTTINDNQGVFRDRLFFARQTAGTDAYTYNTATYNDFVYSATNADGFITTTFGSSIKIGDNKAVPLDFVMFSSINRTSQPIYIDMTISDRYGNSADCNSMFTFRIEIEVVNTKPNIVNPDHVEELAVTAVSLEDGRILKDTHVFAANGNDDRDGLMEDIDGDTPAYIVSRGVLIANTRDLVTTFRKVTSFEEMGDDLTAYTTTPDGRDLTDFISARLDSNRELIVTALNSTKAIASGVYVYFFVTDNNGGTSLGYVQVEVVNTLPLLNTSEEDGFTKQNGYLWSIESTSNSDISRDRYIVGSEQSKTLLKTESPADADPNISIAPTDPDIKLIATDADALHDRLVLSQITAVKNTSTGEYETINYINLTKAGDVATRDEFERAVPSVNTDAIDFTGSPSAVIVYLRNNGTDTTLDKNMAYKAEFLFYVGGKWVNRSDLITELMTGSQAVLDECFDDHGRWIVDLWALHLKATAGFGSKVDVGVSFSLRDNTELGGSTAGEPTAYNSNRNNKKPSGELDNRVKVDGGLITTVYQHISRTGIRSLNEFIGKNDDYYVVEYVDDKGKATNYLSTYDGDTESLYGSGDTVGTLTVGGKTIKTRTEGEADNTLAGTNSGVKYGTGVNTDGAFKYADTIVIPAATTGATTEASRPIYKDVNVPMSYFGLMETLATPVAEGDEGSVKYNTEYVGYDVPDKDGVKIDLGELSTIAAAISLSDGGTTWTGNSGELALSENPYINITPFYYDISKGATAKTLFDDEYSKPYYNNRLAVTTINDKGELIGFDNMLDANKNSFVGDGTIMYLEEQSDKLIEHNFGLTFSKKDVRTGERNLTLKIELAKCENGIITAEEDSDRRTVEVKIRVENSMFDLYEHEGGVLKYDEDNGTYYVDILDLQSSDSISFALTRRNVNGTLEAINPDYLPINPDIIKIGYVDEDFSDNTYRDYVAFSAESFESVDSWYSGKDSYKRATVLNDAQNGFANTAVSYKAQNSVANYYGLTKTDDGVYDSVKDGELNLAAVDGKYKANDGMYGSTREGYSSYFNASTVDNGKIINITALRKTFINDIVFTGMSDLTQAKVIAEYAKRGLIAEYASDDVDPLKPTRVYYPLKVLVFDSCGAGWNDASYTSIEFRITIVNGNPKLKKVGEGATVNGTEGRVYTIDLAVGNTSTLNLYDFVTDPDIYIMGTNGIYSLATDAQFKSDSSGVERETGDYLDSPISYDPYWGKTYDPEPMKDGDIYYYNGGGFTTYQSAEYENRDVVMWMETTSSDKTIPTRNYISFTVNRRTTAVYEGKNIYIGQYRFTLNFRDSSKAETAYITFIINILNQTPSIVATERSFTMRAGDDITVLTSYYDVFTGADAAMKKAFASSQTSTVLYYRENNDGYGTSNGDGRNNAVKGYWVFRDITSEKKSELITDATADNIDRENGTYLHLGYLGLADDDTPWRLRITHVDYNNEKLEVNMRDTIRLLNEHNTDSNNVAVRIEALSACVNEPVTFTIIDGEGGEAKVTLYFTVVSSAPIALDCADADEKTKVTSADLEGVEDESNDGIYVDKTFRLFTVASDTSARYSIEGFPGETKLAKKSYTIPMTSVARDPDGANETNNMTLYGDGYFAVNGKALVADARGVFHADYFDISVTNGGKSLVITSTGYNPDGDGYEVLTFRIADYGNPAFENTLEITLHVYTLYSDIVNPTVGAMDDKAYDAYLAGSDVVNVVSYDDYYDTSKQTDKSKYAYVKLSDNLGNTNNDKSPIVDPDAKALGDSKYSAVLYAFIDVDGDGNITKLSADKLKSILTHTKGSNLYYLNSADDYSDYIIGGVDANGKQIELTREGEKRYDAVFHYASFEFSADCTSLRFAPNSSTLKNENVLLYVEAAKPMGDRMYKRSDAILQAGNLFRLNVIDSKPTAIGSALTFEGRRGDTDSFKVFDSNDLLGTLFVDADADDTVSVFGMKDGKLEDAQYKTVMAEAEKLKPGLKWQADGAKPRAFDLSVDKDNNLIIQINRRIDYVVNGVSQPSVTFPIVITGVDTMGETTTTTITLTIHNTDVTTVDYFGKNDENGVGYMFTADEYDAYRMEVTLRYGKQLDVELDEFMHDADIIDGADTDSYRYVNATASSTQTYLVDTPDYARAYELKPDGTINPDKFTEVALVEPLGDKNARTGIRFNAVTTQRNLTATIYVRIIDRSGNAEAEGNGITIKINVTVVNDAPFVKDSMENSVVYLMGSEKSTPKGMLFYIGDFVDDNNDSDVVGDVDSAKNRDTYLRVFRQDSRLVENIYSQMYSTVVDGLSVNDKVDIMSTALFTVTFPDVLDEQLLREYCETHGVDYDYKDTTNNYRQWFVITPRQGYYGNGAIDVTVADGDVSVMFDTLTTSFCIQVHVVCNPDEVIGEMNEIVIACGKTKTVDLKTLVPDIQNKLVIESDSDTGVITSADGNVFNQYEYYELVDIEFQNEVDKNKATFTKLADGQTWELKAGNQITLEPVRVAVRFKLKNDPDSKIYRKYFYLTIITNQAPKAIYSSITFSKNNKGEPDSLRDLDAANTIRLSAWELFTDPDDPDGSAIRLLSVDSQVSSIVKASIEKDESGQNRYLVLTFVARGESVITVQVTDETGVPVSLKFTARNNDLPEGSMWVRISASFEAHTLVWIIVICCVLLLLILLIILIAILLKRKQEREEIEALLVSEMEIEEQMLKLAGGSSAPTPGYQSYGYLPPTGEQPQSLDSGSAPLGADGQPVQGLPSGQNDVPPDGTE